MINGSVGSIMLLPPIISRGRAAPSSSLGRPLLHEHIIDIAPYHILCRCSAALFLSFASETVHYLQWRGEPRPRGGGKNLPKSLKWWSCTSAAFTQFTKCTLKCTVYSQWIGWFLKLLLLLFFFRLQVLKKNKEKLLPDVTFPSCFQDNRLKRMPQSVWDYRGTERWADNKITMRLPHFSHPCVTHTNSYWFIDHHRSGLSARHQLTHLGCWNTAAPPGFALFLLDTQITAVR